MKWTCFLDGLIFHMKEYFFFVRVYSVLSSQQLSYKIISLITKRSCDIGKIFFQEWVPSFHAKKRANTTSILYQYAVPAYRGASFQHFQLQQVGIFFPSFHFPPFFSNYSEKKMLKTASMLSSYRMHYTHFEVN